MGLRVLMLLALLTGAVSAHEVPVDWSQERLAPRGVTLAATTTVTADGDGAYRFTAEDEHGRVVYRVLPSRAGLLAVRAQVNEGSEFGVTDGLCLSARNRGGAEVRSDGVIRHEALAIFDPAEDGPGGYTAETTGHGPCLRLGDTLPIAAHTEGHVSWPMDAPDGRYRVGVRYMDDRDDRGRDALLRLRLGDRILGEWNLTANDDAWHERWFETDVRRGDVLRIEARSDDSGGHGADFCRVSHVLLQPVGATVPSVRFVLAGETLIVRQGPLAEGVPEVVAEVALEGRALKVQLSQEGEATPPAGLTMVELLPGSDLAGARLVAVPYVSEPAVLTAGGVLFSAFADRFRSHCTALDPRGRVEEEAGRASAFGRAVYLPNSAGRYFELAEVLYLTASPRLLDVLPSFPARRAAAGRAELSRRVVFDHWRMALHDGLAEQIRTLGECGFDDLLLILHTWMRYGYDRKQPQFTPANPLRWTPGEFQAAIDACRDNGFRVAVHENYNHMDWDSPYNSPTPAREFGEPDRPGDPGPEEAETLVAADPGSDLARRPRNAWAFARLADGRVAPGPLTRPEPPAFPISSDKMLFYSQLESHKIRDLYGTTAGYLDVTPCVQPGLGTWDLHIDLDARNRRARGFGEAYRNATELFAHHADLFQITTGEGGEYATYHAGYIQAVERQVRTRTATPILPEHELRVVRPLALHHGMGYYSRYFDEGATLGPADFDRYRAMTIAFGHAGFMGDALFVSGLPGPEAFREYYLLRGLQEAYADAPLRAVEYAEGEGWLDTEQALAGGYDFARARLRLRYETGLTIVLNFDPEQVWRVEVGGRTFELPPYGFAAMQAEPRLEVWSAVVDGEREDHADGPDYTYEHRRDPDDGAPHVAVRPARGLVAVGLSVAPTDAIVNIPAALREPRLRLVVVNPAESPRHLRVDGLPPGHVAIATGRRPPRGDGVLPVLTWTPRAAGRWRMALAYRYTDPEHPAEATEVSLVDSFDGAITVTEQGEVGPERLSTARRNAGFVELAATLAHPATAVVGQPVALALRALRFGAGGADQDDADRIALVLTREDGEGRDELPFPDAPRRTKLAVERRDSEALVALPPLSLTVFAAEDETR